ncbi:hypothetical protein E2C01_006620 [Portunus trituberculatus]|uniref:Uncharacterized protein n=1 Tax=Portunus trituberculatus TaxID=210409 RepID=A0A5B7CYB9_PORTR|nr:hypothetical protein [Portunus trituberculatus]
MIDVRVANGDFTRQQNKSKIDLVGFPKVVKRPLADVRTALEPTFLSETGLGVCVQAGHSFSSQVPQAQENTIVPPLWLICVQALAQVQLVGARGEEVVRGLQGSSYPD